MLILIAHVSSCKKSETPTAAGDSTNAIVLIFKDIPYISDTCQFTIGSYNKTYESEVAYYDDFRLKHIGVTKNVSVDTLTLTPNSNNVILRHRYDAFNYYEYLFERGDTVVFTYQHLLF